MSKKEKMKKITYIAPVVASILILRGIFTGEHFNITIEIMAVFLAAIGFVGGILALTQENSTKGRTVIIAALVLILYLGCVAVYRLTVSDIGFLG